MAYKIGLNYKRIFDKVCKLKNGQTYKVKVQCTNCKFVEENREIPQGFPVYDERCRKCECKTLLALSVYAKSTRQSN